MLVSEKKLTSTSTHDTFDEIYTNYDLSVDETYSAANGYPFDYPTRWLNDPSMNKRIAIRRLDATPTSHSFTLTINAEVNEPIADFGSKEQFFAKTIKVDITYMDNMIKVMNHLCNEFSYENDSGVGRLVFSHSNSTNKLHLEFLRSDDNKCQFQFTEGVEEFLRFLNQEISPENISKLQDPTNEKEFEEVWNRDRLHFHASLSTSRRKFIGKRGDFYQNLSLLYPPPTNESTFYIRMTSNGIKNILLRYCEFDVQLCFIVNYKKAKVL